MCVAHEKSCSCGERSASFHYRDNIMGPEVVENLYCPSCSSGVPVDPGTMMADNGWLIQYNMDAARLLAKEEMRAGLSPALLFDEGYCTWHGIYPGDHIDSVKEREGIVALARSDPREYLNRLKTWATERASRLCDEGWRKAQSAA